MLKHVYWNDEEYPFDPEKRYLVFYGGNFSPVTQGHFSVVQKFVALPNVLVYISHIGSERRHGIPLDLSMDMWKAYLALLTPEQQARVILRQRQSGTGGIEAHLQGVNVVIYVRGNETKSLQAAKTPANQHMFGRQEQRIIQKHASLRNMCTARQIQLDFIFNTRTSGISATDFTMSVKQRKPFEHVKQYMPLALPEDVAKSLIDRMSQQRLRKRGIK